MDPTTYILTAEMDADSFRWLDGLRRDHFPVERNFLSAHLTMFHLLSPAQIDRLEDVELPSAPIGLRFDAILFLGFGVAVRARSAELERLRDDVRHIMGGELARQDLQPWKPHVTVQNKAPAETARRLQRMLETDFAERTGTATGLLVWEYLGGPWKLAQRRGFGGL